MKTWIKRSLIGLAITTTLVGGLAVAHGQRHGWHRFNEADIAQMKERMVDRVGSKLAPTTSAIAVRASAAATHARPSAADAPLSRARNCSR